MKCEIAPEKSALSLTAEIITDALVRVAGSKREAVNVLFENHAKEGWVIEGRGSSGNRGRAVRAAGTTTQMRPSPGLLTDRCGFGRGIPSLTTP